MIVTNDSDAGDCKRTGRPDIWFSDDNTRNVALATHCNLRPPDAAPAVILHFIWDALAKFEGAQPIRCSLTAFYCWYLMLRTWPMTVCIWPLTIWPWTFVIYRLWRNQTLYQISAKSSNPLRNYCDFNIWRNDIEHAPHVALRSGILFTKIQLGQPIHNNIKGAEMTEDR